MNSPKRSRDETATQHSEPSHRAGVKRSKIYTETDALVANVLEQLGSELEEQRIAAGVDVVELFSSSSDSREKIIFRLLRGLCSSRKAARLGYFVALTEIFKIIVQYPQLVSKSRGGEVLEYIFHIVKSETEPVAALTTQEKRDYLIGRLSAYNAVVHSAILLKDDGGKLNHLHDLLHNVWEIGARDSILEEQCGKLYCDIIRIVRKIEASTEPIDVTFRFLEAKSALRTPEGVAFWIEAMDSGLHIRLPKKIWRHRDPLSGKELPDLSKILSGSSKLQNSSVGRRRDSPHFAWITVLNHLYGDDEPERLVKRTASRNEVFRNFWTKCVDDPYFGKSASPERKAVGFRIFNIVLADAPTWACQLALSPNLVHSMVNQEKKPERYLHQAAIALVESLKHRTQSDRELASTIASMLVFTKELPDPNHIKKSRTILFEIFDAATPDVASILVKTLVSTLRSLTVQGSGEKGKFHRADLSIKTLADTILMLSRRRKDEEMDSASLALSWRQFLLVELAKITYLKWNVEDDVFPESTSSPTTQTRRELESRFWSCLRETLSLASVDNLTILRELGNQMHDQPRANLQPLDQDETVWRAVCNAHEFLAQMDRDYKGHTSGDIDAKLIQAFQVMVLIALLLVYSADQDAVAMIDELQEHYKAFETSTGSKTGSFDDVIEILLSLSSRPEALHRNIAEQVFHTFASHVTYAGLVPFIRVLEEEENSAGQRELFDENSTNGANGVVAATTNDESPEAVLQETHNGTEPKRKAEDVNGIESDPAGSFSGSSDQDDSNSDDDDDDNDDDTAENNDADEALNQSLAEILQTQNIHRGLNKLSVPKENEPSSDESMDDDQMISQGIDEKLAAIFSQQKATSKASTKGSAQKQQQKEARRNMLNFKTRVLDLLGIYVKQNYSSPDALRLMLPCLRLIEKTRTPQLSKKTSDFIDSYLKVAKSKGMPLTISTEEVWNMISEIHDNALRFPSKIHAGCSSKCSLFLSRLLWSKEGAGTMEKIIQLYGTTHLRRCKGNSELPAAFWTDFVYWSISLEHVK